MNETAVILVLASAVMHASWNALAKQTGGGMAVVWLFGLVGAVVYLPLAIGVVIAQQPYIGIEQLVFMAGTVALHIAYYFLLQRGYSTGDLSLVYPLARGTGPVLAVVGAILLLGERPSLAAFAGALLVGAGVFILMGNPATLRGNGHGPAIAYGLLCGLSIAAYTLWDKEAVSTALIPPVLFTWAAGTAQTVLITPVALRYWPTVRHAWRNHRRAVIGIGVLDSLSYILFLIALSVGTVSLLSPLRQTSILIGAFFGVRLLSEEASRRRLIAAAVMFAGLLALTLR